MKVTGLSILLILISMGFLFKILTTKADKSMNVSLAANGRVLAFVAVARLTTNDFKTFKN